MLTLGSMADLDDGAMLNPAPLLVINLGVDDAAMVAGKLARAPAALLMVGP